jgi:hypothetical protein
MNMLPMNLEQDARIRQEEIARAVDKIRQAEQVEGQPASSSLFKTALARTGKMLTHVGNELQERYGEMPTQVEAPGTPTFTTDCC